MTWHGKYRTLDCRDGRHLACETCDCLCHIELRVMPDDWHGKYRTLDCRDGRHLACETCDCLCHIELRVMPDD